MITPFSVHAPILREARYPLVGFRLPQLSADSALDLLGGLFASAATGDLGKRPGGYARVGGAPAGIGAASGVARRVPAGVAAASASARGGRVDDAAEQAAGEGAGEHVPDALDCA